MTSQNEKSLQLICLNEFLGIKHSSSEFVSVTKQTFHVSGKLNKHNVRIWGSEHPHVIRELQRDSPKVNVWCGILCNRVVGPFFLHEAAINTDVYFDLPTEYVLPQLIDVQPTIMFQLNGAPPHWRLLVCQLLNETFSD